MSPKTLKVVGPFFTNYSYARVNRGLALAMSRIQQEYKIFLWSDKDKIDYWPSEFDLEKKPELKALFDLNGEMSDIVIYNNYPKTITALHGFADLPGKTKLMYIAWEESIYPKQWVDEANQHLHGILAATSFVKEILINSGIKIPIEVVYNAMDDRLKKEPTGSFQLNTNKRFKFFHNSTAKLRKGVDVLIKSYCEEFTNKEDVVLVIKGAPGPDNEVESLITKYKTENSPEVIHINRTDLTEDELLNLTAMMDCAVYPSRAEGFGLPVLEAMYYEVPVIATNYSGYLDFCDEDCAYMIDYKMQYAKDSEQVNIGAMWAEPNGDNLKKIMRHVYELPLNSEELKSKIKIAKSRSDNISWNDSAKRALEFVKEIESISDLKQKNAAVLSFMNDQTGISAYTKDLYGSVESSFSHFFYLANGDIADRKLLDEKKVVRLWNSGDSEFDQILNWVKENSIDFFHIQYHSGVMFSIEALDSLIVGLKALQIRTIVTLHAVRGESFDFIKQSKNLISADKVFIHNKDDFDYASQTLKNTVYMTHPTINFKKRNKKDLKLKLGLDEKFPIIVTHGLLNKNKGISQVLDAINILKSDYPDILYLALNAVSSNNVLAQGIFNELKAKISEYKLENNVQLIPGFLDSQVVEPLMQVADVIVFAYEDAGESASGAVGKGLASGNSIVLTNIKQFDEFEDECLKISCNSPEEIVKALKQVLEDKYLQTKIQESAQKYVVENSYGKKAILVLQALQNA